jgi:hypothetical protein
MSKTVVDCIRRAAEGFAIIPDQIKDSKMRDSIPTRQDWDEFKRKLCACIRAQGCPILESELDEFWEDNSTFGELIEYIDEHCGYQDQGDLRCDQ